MANDRRYIKPFDQWLTDSATGAIVGVLNRTGSATAESLFGSGGVGSTGATGATGATGPAGPTGATGSGGGSAYLSIGADVTASRALTLADFSNLITVNSAANVALTIPTDAVLGITSTTNVRFKLFYRSTGIAVVTATNTILKYTGYPTPAINVTEVYSHVGADQWAVE